MSPWLTSLIVSWWTPLLLSVFPLSFRVQCFCGLATLSVIFCFVHELVGESLSLAAHRSSCSLLKTFNQENCCSLNRRISSHTAELLYQSIKLFWDSILYYNLYTL